MYYSILLIMPADLERKVGADDQMLKRHSLLLNTQQTVRIATKPGAFKGPRNLWNMPANGEGGG